LHGSGDAPNQRKRKFLVAESGGGTAGTIPLCCDIAVCRTSMASDNDVGPGGESASSLAPVRHWKHGISTKDVTILQNI
jgi:hypothetical protein